MMPALPVRMAKEVESTLVLRPVWVTHTAYYLTGGFCVESDQHPREQDLLLKGVSLYQPEATIAEKVLLTAGSREETKKQFTSPVSVWGTRIEEGLIIGQGPKIQKAYRDAGLFPRIGGATLTPHPTDLWR
jgi:hypothetical protein